MVAQEGWSLAHFIASLAAIHCGCGEATANFHALDGIDAHHRCTKFGIQLAINRLPKADGNAIGNNFQNGSG